MGVTGVTGPFLVMHGLNDMSYARNFKKWISYIPDHTVQFVFCDELYGRRRHI